MNLDSKVLIQVHLREYEPDTKIRIGTTNVRNNRADYVTRLDIKRYNSGARVAANDYTEVTYATEVERQDKLGVSDANILRGKYIKLNTKVRFKARPSKGPVITEFAF